MTYYLFPLTKEESQNAIMTGWRYVYNHQDRLVEVSDLGYEVNTYDKGTTRIVYNDKVYVIYKDFTDIINHKRIWVAKECVEGADVI